MSTVDLNALRDLAVTAQARANAVERGPLAGPLAVELDPDYPCPTCRNLIHGGYAVLRDGRERGVLRVFSGFLEAENTDFYSHAAHDVTALSGAVVALCNQVDAMVKEIAELRMLYETATGPGSVKA
jgi:hypothetical protein